MIPKNPLFLYSHIKKLLPFLGILFAFLPVFVGETTPALAIANLTYPAKLATLQTMNYKLSSYLG
jgi:hypothetical protein